MWATMFETVFFDNSEKDAMSAFFKQHGDWKMEANASGVMFTRASVKYNEIGKEKKEAKKELPSVETIGTLLTELKKIRG